MHMWHQWLRHLLCTPYQLNSGLFGFRYAIAAGALRATSEQEKCVFAKDCCLDGPGVAAVCACTFHKQLACGVACH